MRAILKIAVVFIVVHSSNGFAANDGKIVRLDFSGGSSHWGAGHSDMVQLSIEGGYETSDCNGTYAAIRKSDSHLVSAALAAFMAGKRVTVRLNSADKYHTNRCVITDMFLSN